MARNNEQRLRQAEAFPMAPGSEKYDGLFRKIADMMDGVWEFADDSGAASSKCVVTSLKQIHKAAGAKDLNEFSRIILQPLAECAKMLHDAQLREYVRRDPAACGLLRIALTESSDMLKRLQPSLLRRMFTSNADLAEPTREAIDSACNKLYSWIMLMCNQYLQLRQALLGSCDGMTPEQKDHRMEAACYDNDFVGYRHSVAPWEVSALMFLLSAGGTPRDVRQQAVHTIGALAADSAASQEALAVAVEPIVRMLPGQPAAGNQQAYAPPPAPGARTDSPPPGLTAWQQPYALACLARCNQDNQRRMLAAGAGPRLVASLSASYHSSVREHAVAALTTLAELEDASVFGPVNNSATLSLLVGPLVVLLSAGHNAEEQAAAAQVLRALSRSHRARDRLVQADGLPHLVALLSTSEPRGTEQGRGQAQEQAAELVCTLSAGVDHAHTIIHAGGAPPLVALLAAGTSSRVQELAAQTLGEVANDAEATERILAAGALPPLVALLADGNTCPVRERATSALCKLGMHGADDVVKAGAFPALVLLLAKDAPSQLQRTAAVAINVLTVSPNDNARKGRAVEAGAVPALVDLLDWAQPYDVLREVAAALGSFVDHADGRAAIVQAGGLPRLVAMLSTTAPVEVIRPVCFALKCMAEGPGGEVAVTGARAVPNLVALLGTERPADVQLGATLVLQRLAREGDSATQIVAEGGVPRLVTLLGHGATGVVTETAARALGNLAAHADARAAIVAAGGAAELRALVEGRGTLGFVREKAAWALSRVDCGAETAAGPRA